MKVITRKYKLEKWKAIITNQMASGLTAVEYSEGADPVLIQRLLEADNDLDIHGPFQTV